jgi:hypothetical protein
MARRIPGHLSELDLALKLGISIWGLRAWRRRGYGPKAVKFGKSVFYRDDVVEAFVKSPLGEASD